MGLKEFLEMICRGCAATEKCKTCRVKVLCSKLNRPASLWNTDEIIQLAEELYDTDPDKPE